MTSRQRKLYVTLFAVKQLCESMRETGNLEKKSKNSLDRIQAKVETVMEGLGAITATDSRELTRIANNLRSQWSQDDDLVTRCGFVAICMAIVDSHKQTLPKSAYKVRANLDWLEERLYTLYKHFDEEEKDYESMNEGEQIAREYIAACI